MQDVSAHRPQGSHLTAEPPGGPPGCAHSSSSGPHRPQPTSPMLLPVSPKSDQGAGSKSSFLWGLILPFSLCPQPPTRAKKGSYHGVRNQRGGAGPAHLQKRQEGGLGGTGLPQHGHCRAQVVDVAAVGIQHHGLGELENRGRLRTRPPLRARASSPALEQPRGGGRGGIASGEARHPDRWPGHAVSQPSPGHGMVLLSAHGLCAAHRRPARPSLRRHALIHVIVTTQSSFQLSRCSLSRCFKRRDATRASAVPPALPATPTAPFPERTREAHSAP